jgi:GT2 family glycosyltransferase
MMMRRSVFEELGGFDEDFFLYFEEVDFSKRVQNAGYEVQFVAQSVVKHVGAASTKLDPSRRLPTYWYDSRHRYFIKHHGRAYAAGADAAALLGHAVCTLYTRLAPREDRSPPRDGAFLDLLGSTARHVLRTK